MQLRIPKLRKVIGPLEFALWGHFRWCGGHLEFPRSPIYSSSSSSPSSSWSPWLWRSSSSSPSSSSLSSSPYYSRHIHVTCSDEQALSLIIIPDKNPTRHQLDTITFWPAHYSGTRTTSKKELLQKFLNGEGKKWEKLFSAGLNSTFSGRCNNRVNGH